MEFNELFNNTIDAEFKPRPDLADGQGLKLKINADLITLDFLEKTKSAMRQVEAKKNPLQIKGKMKLKDAKPEQQIEWVEDATQGIDFMARVLGGAEGSDDSTTRAISDWELLNKGEKVPVSYEALIKFPFITLSRLFDFCINQVAKPTKEEKKQSASTSKTQNG